MGQWMDGYLERMVALDSEALRGGGEERIEVQHGLEKLTARERIDKLVGDHVRILMITAAIWVFQVILSTWWLRRYNFGPVEWLWRTLAYGKRPPMRKAIKA